MIDRLQSDTALYKAIGLLWLVRDHVILEEPKAADYLVNAILEVQHARKEILRLLPASTATSKEVRTK